MKKVYILALALLSMVFTSCEDRFDFLEGTSFGVVIGLNSESVITLTDSIKVSLKNGTDKYSLSLFINSEPDATFDIAYTFSGVASFVDNENNPVPADKITLINGRNDFSILVSQPGDVELTFSLINEFGNTKKSTFKLVAFDNLAPVAILDILSVKELSDFEYDLDATSSFDRDAKFGGGVARYRYKIDTAEIFTDKDKIRIIFPSSGSFEVSLEVQDFDEAWSEIDIQTFVVE